MAGRLKLDRSGMFILLYSVFMVLFTVYIIHHFPYGHFKGDSWWYYIRAIFFSGEAYFIIQGLLLRSKNWGIVLLLFPAALVATAIILFLFVFVLRWGGGDLLDRDGADMIFSTIVFTGLSIYALKWIKPRGGKRK